MHESEIACFLVRALVNMTMTMNKFQNNFTFMMFSWMVQSFNVPLQRLNDFGEF